MGAGFGPVFGVPESTPASRPFSFTIRLNTSPTERTPGPGFQSYLPDMTRASPVNLSESVPASFAKAAWIPTGCACANGTIRATASAHTPYRVKTFIIWNSFRHYSRSLDNILISQLVHPFWRRLENSSFDLVYK